MVWYLSIVMIAAAAALWITLRRNPSPDTKTPDKLPDDYPVETPPRLPELSEAEVQAVTVSLDRVYQLAPRVESVSHIPDEQGRFLGHVGGEEAERHSLLADLYIRAFAVEILTDARQRAFEIGELAFQSAKQSGDEDTIHPLIARLADQYARLGEVDAFARHVESMKWTSNWKIEVLSMLAQQFALLGDLGNARRAFERSTQVADEGQPYDYQLAALARICVDSVKFGELKTAQEAFQEAIQYFKELERRRLFMLESRDLYRLLVAAAQVAEFGFISTMSEFLIIASPIVLIDFWVAVAQTALDWENQRAARNALGEIQAIVNETKPEYLSTEYVLRLSRLYKQVGETRKATRAARLAESMLEIEHDEPAAWGRITNYFGFVGHCHELKDTKNVHRFLTATFNIIHQEPDPAKEIETLSRILGDCLELEAVDLIAEQLDQVSQQLTQAAEFPIESWVRLGELNAEFKPPELAESCLHTALAWLQEREHRSAAGLLRRIARCRTAIGTFDVAKLPIDSFSALSQAHIWLGYCEGIVHKTAFRPA